MDRRSFITGSASAFAAASSGAQRSEQQGAAPPGTRARARNVLLIIADDQGLDAGCYGKSVKTPNLDALAAQSTLFTRGYATVSSCSSSRSVLYTGLYSHTNGMYGLAHDIHNQSLLDWVVTLPKLMRSGGYATAIVGKKHVRPDSALPYDAELVPERAGVRDVEAMTIATGKFIRQQRDKPFFVTVGFSDPHRAEVNFGNTQPWPGIQRITYEPSQVEIPSHLPDLPEVRQDLAEYYESVSRLDSGVGLLLKELRASGREEDTLVIFLSDNGRAFAGAKTTLYDAGIHLPLIIRAPHISGGTRCEAMVSWSDITPTILNFARVSGPPYELPGRSLLPLLGQAHASGWDRVYASHSFHEINQYYPMRSVRTTQHSYIVNLAHELSYPIAGDVASSASWKGISASRAKLGKRTLNSYLQRPAEELYDLTKDPDEIVNVAAHADYKDVLTSMRADLHRWRSSTKDPWLEGQTVWFAHPH